MAARGLDPRDTLGSGLLVSPSQDIHRIHLLDPSSYRLDARTPRDRGPEKDGTIVLAAAESPMASCAKLRTKPDVTRESPQMGLRRPVLPEPLDRSPNRLR